MLADPSRPPCDRHASFWRTPESTSNVVLSIMDRRPCVYILASQKRGTLYIGVTSDVIKRVWEHKHDVVAGYTSDYKVHDLVWFELHATMQSAIAREKALKFWKRAWKLRLIEETNPDWRDLYADIV